MLDIRHHFGIRVRELRLRSGMSQETLAHRAGLDRTYITDVERGTRNISLVNIEKIAAALTVSIEYLFAGERFSATPTYQQKDFTEPIQDRFKYHLDPETRVLAFTVKGLLTPQDVAYMDRTLIGICAGFGRGEISLLVDHRLMLAADGEPAVYSPEVTEKAIEFQKNLLIYSKKVAVLCNSQFMVQNLNHVTSISGIYNQSYQLFGKDRFMVQEAYEILGITGNELVREKG
ncbi:helix-turn-helix domain-containing protein [Paenibacillus sp. GYB003]|uniref:helix-turn-helix domain-containing protein n=1 Tax=Paenibacillus sp. GYB003 TaxID=2994392 RepID=UPI002F96BF61